MDCMDEQRPDITLYFKAGVNILDEGLLWERKVENEMEKALLNHEYKVYLQPKYSVGDEKLAAVEAISLAKKLNMGIWQKVLKQENRLISLLNMIVI